MRQLLSRVNDTQPHVANALELLNRKVTLIGDTLSQSDLSFDKSKLVDANISESGIDFPAQDSFDEKSLLALKLILPNDSLGLLLYGEVVRCRPLKQGYRVSINFLKMPERCRSILARTLMRAQMRQRRVETLDPKDGDLRH